MQRVASRRELESEMEDLNKELLRRLVKLFQVGTYVKVYGAENHQLMGGIVLECPTVDRFCQPPRELSLARVLVAYPTGPRIIVTTLLALTLPGPG